MKKKLKIKTKNEKNRNQKKDKGKKKQEQNNDGIDFAKDNNGNIIIANIDMIKNGGDEKAEKKTAMKMIVTSQ